MFGSIKKSAAVFLAAASGFVLIASPAWASGAEVIADCNLDGSIDGKYSTSELRNALDNLAADVNEYGDCRSLIEQALLDSVSKKPGKGPKRGDAAELSQVTTAAQRKKTRRSVEQSAKLPKSGPVARVAGAEVARAGSTLESTGAPGVPVALIVALVGLALLFSVDLAGRLANIGRMKKFLPKAGRRSGLPD
ncbi:MAG: hypothetical protein WAO61_05300 [Solirubrobacterales bacterium]